MTAATVFNLHQEVAYDNITCYRCGIVFWVPSYFKKKRISDKQNFWCPNGHDQAYVGESDREKAKRLQRELDEKKAALQASWDEKQKLAKANKKLRSRIKAGVCPCCTRTFTNLARHIKTKHPEFSP